MIILGIILVFVAWALPQVLPDVPPGIDHVVYVGGWLLIIIGVILWILSYLGVAVGRGIGAGPRGRRYWW
jgi:hypothetical protein